jgi:TolA-binding protein
MNQDRIERYINKDMTPDERMEFEAMMNADTELQREVLQFQKAIEALKVYEHSQLKARLQQREKDSFTNQKKTAIHWIWYLTAGLALIFTMWLFFSTKNSVKEDLKKENTIKPGDSSIPGRNKIKPEDSFNINKESLPADENPPLKSGSSKAEEIFADHFVPYTDELMESTVRGEEEKGAYEEFLSLYNDGKFLDALQIFDSMDPVMKDNDNVLFLKANALMAVNRIDMASRLFENIIRKKNSRYLKEAYWYLALCELKKGDVYKAKYYLQNPLLNGNTKCHRLLEKIEK